MHHIGSAEGLGEGFWKIILNQILAVVMVPDELARIFRTNLFQPPSYLVQRCLPRDLHPARIFVRSLFRVGALERCFDPVGVVGIEGSRGTLGADALIVNGGAGGIGIDGADDLPFHLHHLPAEVHAVHAGGFLIVFARLGFGGLRRSLGGRLGDEGQLNAQARAEGTGALRKAPSGKQHHGSPRWHRSGCWDLHPGMLGCFR